MEARFVERPQRTLIALTLPVLLSLIAEPLAGLADTAFVARLGVTPLAAVGVSATLLSGLVWVFNFLGVGVQTEVAHALGSDDVERGRRQSGLAVVLALGCGVVFGVLVWPVLEPAVRWMGAEGALEADALVYLRIRLLGVPAGLLALVAFGILRGLQEMRATLWVALAMSVANVLLDPLLIFGAGPIPALGVAGAAWATVVSQWGGALFGLAVARQRFGWSARAPLREAVRLLVVGRDMVLRTSLLLLFSVLATRAATRAGAESGAAHQALRQVWILSAMLLDAFAATAQSLIGFFVGAGRRDVARRVAAVACQQAFVCGFALALAMWLGEGPVAALLVPDSARAVFAAAWLVLLLAQPLNGLAFATDGIHWGTSDYGYLRNAMLVATGLGAALLAAIDLDAPGALVAVWLTTGLWIAVRALFGMLRIWPGIGRSPLRATGAAVRVAPR